MTEATTSGDTIDHGLACAAQVVRYGRINLLLSGHQPPATQEEVLGFPFEMMQELCPQDDPRVTILLMHGRAEIVDLDIGLDAAAQAIRAVGETLYTGRYCRVLLRAEPGEAMAKRVRQVVARAEGHVCAPVVPYDLFCEYPVAPHGERGPVLADPAMMAARLMRAVEGVCADWTLTGEERFSRYGLRFLPRVCIESLAAGFRDARHLCVSGLGVEIRLAP